METLLKTEPERRCSVRGWGVSARLAASSDDLLQLTLTSLPSGFEVSPSRGRGPLFRIRTAGRSLDVREGERRIFSGRSRRAFRMAVADAFETLASVHSGKFAFLHAGCVEIDGRVVLLPGRSHAGKSTLVTALLSRGAAYLSDDMIPIDRKLLAHPFPRPIGIRSATGGSPKRTPIKSLGARPADRALPIALVWCGVYDPLASRPTFEPRPGLSAFAELLAHSPGAQLRPEVIVPILTGIARTVPVFAGVRGDTRAMVDAIFKRLRTT